MSKEEPGEGVSLQSETRFLGHREECKVKLGKADLNLLEETRQNDSRLRNDLAPPPRRSRPRACVSQQASSFNAGLASACVCLVSDAVACLFLSSVNSGETEEGQSPW